MAREDLTLGVGCLWKMLGSQVIGIQAISLCIVIYNKKYILGLHPIPGRAPETLEFPS